MKTGKTLVSAGLATIAAAAALAVCVWSYDSADSENGGHVATADILPQEPDYDDASQWYLTDRGAEADIFYVISTETGDYPADGGVVMHYADTYSDSLRLPMRGEMEGVDSLLSGRLNFVAPYYRQCSLQTFTSDSLKTARMAVATADVRRAFDNYIRQRNGGRPFVLAGFSQGAFIVLDLLRDMDEETFSRMIAAYAIGIPVRAEDLASPHITAARGADDTGVTVNYNSVRDASCTLWEEPSRCCINPVNWRTDSTAATLVTEPSPLVPVESQKKDTMTVRQDCDAQLLTVDGLTATDYVLPLIGCEGNYHSREIWLYRDCLRENIAVRTARFIEAKNAK